MRRWTRREFSRAALVAASAAATPGRAATGATAAIDTPAGTVDPLSMVDPELRPALVKLLPDIDQERYTLDTLKSMRKLSDQWGQPPSASPPFEKRTLPAAAGRPPLDVYVVNRQPGRKRPAILHVHGGGYILGRAVDAIQRLQRITAEQDCLAVTVDYRLAPEVRYPQSLDDNYAALRWLHDHADDLGVDRRRIAVMGESAGGGHAAALAIAARDRGEVSVCFQALIYPMLDDRTGSTRQPPPWVGAFVWKREANVFGWSSLLGVPAGSLQVPRGAVPARVVDLARLPPAFIGVGSVDLFVDEDIEYARRLIEAGVPTELQVVAGGYHGFNEIAPAARSAVSFEKSLSAALARGFRRDQASST